MRALRSLRLPKLEPTTWLYAFIALLATAPAWIVKYPPMQDLPFHLATIRVIHSIHDPTFGLDGDFILTLGRTQYVLYYLIGSALSYVLGIVNANIVLMCGYLGGTVLALRALLKALGKDERLCLFVVPLLVNVMFMYGLFPFLLGIPIMFAALATAVRYFERPSVTRGALLSALALALFYSHIFPFGLFGIGFAVMFPWTRPREWIRAGLPMVPAVSVLAWWTLTTDAGKLVRGALTDTDKDPKLALDQSISEVPKLLTNIFSDTGDEAIFIATGVVALLALGLAFGDRERARTRGGPARAYVLLPIACVYFYFTSPQGHGYIWLIAQRFPILFLMTAIPLLRMPSGWRGAVVMLAALGVASASIVNTCKHFIQFQLEEVGDFDGALAAMDPKKKVCALMFDNGAHVTAQSFVPFMHFGSYYQALKGGVVMFTYAGYDHWPFQFQEGHYPPQGKKAKERWEWLPNAVSIGEIHPYYDYVLTRGPGFNPPPGTYRSKWRGDKWTVWAKE